MTDKMRCILSERCKSYATESCNAQCPHYVLLHSKSGRHTLSSIASDYAFITLKSAPCRNDQPKVYATIDAYVKTFTRQFNEGENDKPVRSLYLFSASPGTGKTTTASAILNEWLAVHYIGSTARNRQAHEKPAYFLDVNEWQSYYNKFNRSNVPKEIGEQASSTYYHRMNNAKHAPFAVLDDIGVRDCSEAFRGDLHEVINYRVSNRLPTVYTSNLPITELADVFDERLYDRVRHNCAVLTFEGGSQRGFKKSR